MTEVDVFECANPEAQEKPGERISMILEPISLSLQSEQLYCDLYSVFK